MDPITLSLAKAYTEETVAGMGAVKGDDGTTFTPSVSSNGILSWTNNGGLPNPAPVNIQGPAGKNGTNGVSPHVGENGNWFVGDTDTGIKAGLSYTTIENKTITSFADLQTAGIPLQTIPPYDAALYFLDNVTFEGQQPVNDGRDNTEYAIFYQNTFATIVAKDHPFTGKKLSVDTIWGVKSIRVNSFTDDGEFVKIETTANNSVRAHDVEYNKREDNTIIYSTVEKGLDEAFTRMLPKSGTTGQILAKKTDTNYDTEWVDAPTGGVTMDQVNAAIEEAIGTIETALAAI